MISITTFQLFVFLFCLKIFNLVLDNFHPLTKGANSPFSNDRFLWERQIQPWRVFQITVRAVSQDGVTHSQENSICPLPHTWAQRHPSLARVVETAESNYTTDTQSAWPILLSCPDGCCIFRIQSHGPWTIEQTLLLHHSGVLNPGEEIRVQSKHVHWCKLNMMNCCRDVAFWYQAPFKNKRWCHFMTSSGSHNLWDSAIFKKICISCYFKATPVYTFASCRYSMAVATLKIETHF